MKNRFKIKNTTLCPLVLAIIISLGSMIYPLNRVAYAHTFSGGESASFLALTTQISSEISLVQSNVPSNLTLAQDHAKDGREHLDANTTKELTEKNKRVADDLVSSLESLQNTVNSTSPTMSKTVKDSVDRIDGLLQEAISVRIEPDQLKNATVHILAVNNLLAEITEHYRGAYGIESEKNESSTQNKIVNVADYQSAQSLANQTVHMFDDIKKLTLSSNITSSPAFEKISSGLTSLQNAIDTKKSFNEIRQIIGTQIRPNIESAFDLKLNTE
jgi:hypothetical protein